MSNINLKLYTGNDLVEASQLRSVLLFSEFGKDEDKKSLMMQRVILSLIIQSEGKYDLDQLYGILKEKHHAKLTKATVSSYLSKLISAGLITMVKGAKYKSVNEEDAGRTYFDALENDTDKLIQGVFDRYEKLRGAADPHSARIKDNIRQALSVYYKISGLVFFGLQKDNEGVKQAVQVALDKLEEADAKRLVNALGDTISNPTPQEKITLEKWAKAYVITQVLNLDPTLDNFKQEKLRQKSFVLDTDVLLHTLCTHATYSEQYRRMVTYLNEVGCKIYVPKDVIKEVKGHAEEALEIAADLTTEQMLQLDDFMLVGSKSNVFIEDFVKQIRSDETLRKMPFDIYMGNIYNPKNISVMATRLKNIVGEENLLRELPEVELDEEVKSRLEELILEKTAVTPKGQDRSDSFNAKVSEADARLYLTLAKQCGSSDGNEILGYKFYSITQSTKTIKCAKTLGIYKEDIICNPQALISILEDLGNVVGNDTDIINLFENPFLAFTADNIWEQIKPVLEAGATIYFQDIQQLRARVDERFDKILTCKDETEREVVTREYSHKGYLFPKEIARLSLEKERLQQENTAKDEMIAKQQKKIDALKKERGKQRYIDRVNRNKKKRR